MRLLVLINNYQGNNSTNTSEVLEKVVWTFSRYEKLDVDIVLFSTRSYPFDNVVNLVYPVELSYAFSFVPRQWIVENFYCLSHDYILYTENDLIIPERSVLNCIENMVYVSQVSEKYISGFIRYENKADGKKYIDMLPADTPTVVKVLKAENGKKYWIPGNMHSGNFLLSYNQLDAMIDHQKFQTHPAQYGKQYYGILESAASDVYLDFIKVLPEDFASVEIEHLSNKYDGLSHRQLRNDIHSVWEKTIK